MKTLSGAFSALWLVTSISSAYAQEVTDTPAGLVNNGTLISPPGIRQPLLECATSVGFEAFLSGAKIKISVFDEFGGHQGDATGDTLRGPRGTVEVDLGGMVLQKGWRVEAHHELDYSASQPPAISATVEAFTESASDYLNQAPPPTLLPEPIYECGHVLMARGVAPSASVLFEHQTQTQPGIYAPPQTILSRTADSDGTAYGVLPNPSHAQDDRIVATYSVCGASGAPVFGPSSENKYVSPAPQSLPEPVLLGATGTQDASVVVVDLEGILPGALLRFYFSSGGISETYAFAGGRTSIWLDLPAGAEPGDTMYATQELCVPASGGGSNPIIVPQPTAEVACSELGAPTVGPVAIGAQRVWVTTEHPDAHVHVFANGLEIGEGSAPLVYLVRALLPGDDVYVVQSINGCLSDVALRIELQCGQTPATELIPATGPYSVGELEYHSELEYAVSEDSSQMSYLAYLHARVYYPSTSNGYNTPLIGSSGLPIIFVSHGNSGLYGMEEYPGESLSCPDAFSVLSGMGVDVTPTAEVESFLGYEYVAKSLASRGFVVVSVDYNDLHCDGRESDIGARAELLGSHILHWAYWTGGTRVLDDPDWPDVYMSDGIDVEDGGLSYLDKFIGRVSMSRVGLLGHSRGGNLSTQLYKMCQSGVGVCKFFDIQAIAALSPTDVGEIAINDVPLLLVLGDHDGDLVNLPGQRVYDRSLSGSTAWSKSQVVIPNGNHNFFNSKWPEEWQAKYRLGTLLQQSATIPPGGLVDRGDQEAITREHVLRFFRRSLLNVGEFGFHSAQREIDTAVLRGDQSVSASTMVDISWRSKAACVVDDVDNGLQGLTTSGGAVSTYNSPALFIDDLKLERPSDQIYHKTKGLMLGWSHLGYGGVVLPLKDCEAAWADATTLSFRSTQAGAAAFNGNNPPVLSVEGHSIAGPEVGALSTVASAIPPISAHPTVPKGIMRSLRLPMMCLQASPEGTGQSVDSLVLHSDGNISAKGLLVIDDVELY